jgi:hypothetical protein
MNLTYRAYLEHPEVRARIEAEAHRRRMSEIGRLIFRPVAALFRK